MQRRQDDKRSLERRQDDRRSFRKVAGRQEIIWKGGRLSLEGKGAQYCSYRKGRKQDNTVLVINRMLKRILYEKEVVEI